MNNKSPFRLDDFLWERTYHNNAHHKSTMTIDDYTDMARKQGFPMIPREEIRRAFDRLISRGKVEQTWNGKKYITKALLQMRPIDDGNSFFIDEQPIKVTDLAARIYSHFVDNRIVGRGKTISMKKLAGWFDISERDLRKVIERINFRGYKFKDPNDEFKYKIKGDISGTNGGYYIVEDEEEQRAMLMQYKQKIYKASRKARILVHDFNLDNQMSAKLIENTENTLKEEIEQEFVRVKMLGDELIVTPIKEEEPEEIELDPFDVAYEEMIKNKEKNDGN